MTRVRTGRHQERTTRGALATPGCEEAVVPAAETGIRMASEPHVCFRCPDRHRGARTAWTCLMTAPIHDMSGILVHEAALSADLNRNQDLPIGGAAQAHIPTGEGRHQRTYTGMETGPTIFVVVGMVDLTPTTETNNHQGHRLNQCRRVSAA